MLREHIEAVLRMQDYIAGHIAEEITLADLAQAAIDRYDPAVVGLAWDTSNPRIQLEPMGAQGYMELLPVCKLS